MAGDEDLGPLVHRAFRWVLQTTNRVTARALLMRGLMVGFLAGVTGVLSGTGPALVAATVATAILARSSWRAIRWHHEFTRAVRGLREPGTRSASAQTLDVLLRQALSIEKRRGYRGETLLWAVLAGAALDAARMHEHAETLLRMVPNEGGQSWVRATRVLQLGSIRLREDDAAGVDAALAEAPAESALPTENRLQFHVLRAGSLTLKGRHEEALALLERVGAPATDLWSARVRAYAHASLGDEVRTREVLQAVRHVDGDAALMRLARRDHPAARIAAAMLREVNAPYR